MLWLNSCQKRGIRGKEWEKRAADGKWRTKELLVFCRAAVFSAVGTLQSVFFFLCFLIFCLSFFSFFYSFESQLSITAKPFSLASLSPFSLLWQTDRQTYGETDRHLQANKRTDWAPALHNENGLYILCYCWFSIGCVIQSVVEGIYCI